MARRAIRAGRASAVCAVALALLAGCGHSLQPYVREVGSFRPDWRSPERLTTVEVCYNRATTTPEAVRRLAEEACAETGAKAEFADSRLLRCSFARPVSAVFICRGGKPKTRSDSRPKPYP